MAVGGVVGFDVGQHYGLSFAAAVLVSDLWGQPWEAAGPKELLGWIDRWTWGTEISDGLRVETVWDWRQIPRSHLNLPLNELQ